MSALRALIAGLLSLILMMGSVTFAVARHEGAGLTAVTLCGTEGAVTVVQLDAAGQPVARGHDCPHCLAASGLGVLAAGPVTLAPGRARDAVLPGQITAEPPAQGVAPLARGPPLAV